MKVEFESILFGLAFLVLALISMPKTEEKAVDAASQTPSETMSAPAATPVSGR